MSAAADPVARIGHFLVELERLERGQRPGVFVTDRIVATSHGVRLHLPSGEAVEFPTTATTEDIARAVRPAIPALQAVANDTEFPFSLDTDVQTGWAQFHYALGAYDDMILADLGVRVLEVQRSGSHATVTIRRDCTGASELYTLDLDREIDFGIADTLGFGDVYGHIGGSLNAEPRISTRSTDQR